MRNKINICPTFPLDVSGSELKIVAQYQKKYIHIDRILSDNEEILDAAHGDLEKWGAEGGRESTYSSEQFLRMLIVKWIEGLSFRDTIVRVADSNFLRNFTRIFSGKMMNFTSLNTAFKLISPATWDRMNDALQDYACEMGKISGDRLRIDSTVCESNIHYPTDSSLLWDCYRVAARLMRQGREADFSLDMGHRFHDIKIKQLYTFIATHSSKKKKSTKRKVRRCTKILIERVGAIVEVASRFVAHGKNLQLSFAAQGIIMELEEKLPSMRQAVIQAQRSFAGEKVPARERVFSIFEPHTELLMRGKAHKPVEFGHMVSIGQTGEKFISFYRVEEHSQHDTIIGDEAKENHKRKFGTYPREFTADKNYYAGAKHTRHWEKRIPVYSVGKKGKRTEEETEREHGYLFKLLQKFRAGCEGSISVLKRVFGLRRCLNRGFRSFAASIGCMVLCHNLVVLSQL